MIQITRTEDGIGDIQIDGQTLETDDGEHFTVPRALLASIPVRDLPVGARFAVCERIEDDVVYIDEVPLTLQRTNDEVLATVEDMGRRKFWDGQVGFNVYMEAKRAVVEERQREIGDVELVEYEDDGDYITLIYAATFSAETCDTVAELAYQLAGEVEGATELRLGKTVWPHDAAKDEKEFTLHRVIPILRKLGFRNVRYNHGKREFGKDITFARSTEFDELEQWAAQVKFGDISGGVNSDIDIILGQVEDAFKMPFYDIYTRARQRISKLVIVASGKFTENAIEKICEKIEDHALRNNVIFIDGDKIETLAEKFR